MNNPNASIICSCFIWICSDIWMDIFRFFHLPQLGLKLALISPRFDALVDNHFNVHAKKTIRRWICNDLWMDILPFFDRPHLGLKWALLSPRFDVFVDNHFCGKTELTIWSLTIYKDINTDEPKLHIISNAIMHGPLPLPERPLPKQIRINYLQIMYIDHCVISFLRSNNHVFDKGTNLRLFVSPYDDNFVQPIWDILVRQIWPLFSTTNDHCLYLNNGDHLNNLIHLTSPTILSDLYLTSIDSHGQFPDVIDDERKSSTAAGRALSKWLHTPTTDGWPKQLHCNDYNSAGSLEWINNFKEAFLHATSCAPYNIHFGLSSSAPIIEPFEFVNERTGEKLTLHKQPWNFSLTHWVLKRCRIGETAAVQREGVQLGQLNTVHFLIVGGNNSIGPLSPPQITGQSSENFE